MYGPSVEKPPFSLLFNQLFPVLSPRMPPAPYGGLGAGGLGVLGAWEK